MTPQAYRSARMARGSRVEVAAKLGVHPKTLAKRERGALPISRETWLALLSVRRAKIQPQEGQPPG